LKRWQDGREISKSGHTAPGAAGTVFEVTDTVDIEGDGQRDGFVHGAYLRVA